MKILSRCPTTDKHNRVQTGSFISNLLALVGFCDLFCFLIRHIASFQNGLFWLPVPVSQEKNPKPYQKRDLFPLVSFFKAAEMKWTNSNYHPVLNPWFEYGK